VSVKHTPPLTETFGAKYERLRQQPTAHQNKTLEAPPAAWSLRRKLTEELKRNGRKLSPEEREWLLRRLEVLVALISPGALWDKFKKAGFRPGQGLSKKSRRQLGRVATTFAKAEAALAAVTFPSFEARIGLGIPGLPIRVTNRGRPGGRQFTVDVLREALQAIEAFARTSLAKSPKRPRKRPSDFWRRRFEDSVRHALAEVGLPASPRFVKDLRNLAKS